MGCRNREFLNDDTSSSSSSSSLSEALIFATLCIIGLPVDVHVKDGSVYTGIFHTACVEEEYGMSFKLCSHFLCVLELFIELAGFLIWVLILMPKLYMGFEFMS